MQNESAENPRDRFDKQKLIRTAFNSPFRGVRLYLTSLAFIAIFMFHMFEVINWENTWPVWLVLAFVIPKEIHDRIDAIAKLAGIEDDETRDW